MYLYLLKCIILSVVLRTAFSAKISAIQNGAIAAETKGVRAQRRVDPSKPTEAPDSAPGESGEQQEGRSLLSGVGGLLMGIGGALAIQKVHAQGASKIFPWLGSGPGSEVEDGDVTYDLYTKKNKKEAIKIEKDSIKGPDDLEKWNVDNGVIIIVHGWMETVTNPDNSPQKLKKAYFGEGRTENIILVDWDKHAANSKYEDSAKASLQIGKRLGQLIVALKKKGLIKDLEKVHIIGHHVGAHIAGIAGNVVQSKSDGKKIGRITGLDPAWEQFEAGLEEEKRLTADDAEYVDVIHCNMGNKMGKFGTTLVIGTSDWFPNGGIVQPQCNIDGIGEPIGICSTNKCYEYYAESIEGKKYKGCLCDDYDKFKEDKCDCEETVLMGESTPTTAKGKFYLKTEEDKQKKKDSESTKDKKKDSDDSKSKKKDSEEE